MEPSQEQQTDASHCVFLLEHLDFGQKLELRSIAGRVSYAIRKRKKVQDLLAVDQDAL